MRSPVKALISPVRTTLSVRTLLVLSRHCVGWPGGPPPRDLATGSLRRVTARSPEWRVRNAVWFLQIGESAGHGHHHVLSPCAWPSDSPDSETCCCAAAFEAGRPGLHVC